MSGNKTMLLADIIKEMFANNPEEAAYTIEQIAEFAIGDHKLTAVARKWVFDTLPRARQHMEKFDGMTFIPVTRYYFETYYGKRPPRNKYGAKKCIAGVGRNGRTMGIRKIWTGHTNDAMAFVWLWQGFKSGANKWRMVVDRLLSGYDKGAVTEAMAKGALEKGYAKLLPVNRTSFAALLPASVQQSLQLGDSNGESPAVKK
jgi:hypothetical protein